MTEKPNSVCKPYTHVFEYARCLKCGADYFDIFPKRLVTDPPVAEPAEPSASPELSLGDIAQFCVQIARSANDPRNADEAVTKFLEREIRPMLNSAPQPVAGEGPTATFGSVTYHNPAEPLIEPDEPSPMIFAPKRGTPKLEASELFEEFCQRFNQFSNYIPADDRNTYLIPLLESLRPFITPSCSPPNFLKLVNGLESDATATANMEEEDDGHPSDYWDGYARGAGFIADQLRKHLALVATPASTGEANGHLLQILRDCGVVLELRKLGRFDSADKLEKILAPTSVPQAEPPKEEMEK